MRLRGRRRRPDRPGRRRPHPGRHDERGAVTAELVMGLPLLVAVTVGLVWLLSVGVAQVRVVDAARETARAAARGDETSAAVGVGRRVVPDGGDVVVAMSGDEVTATATARVRGPGGLFDFLPGVEVSARAVARSEET